MASSIGWASLDDRKKQGVAVAVAKEARRRYGLKDEKAQDVLEFYDYYSADRTTHKFTSREQQALIEIAAGATPQIILREPQRPVAPPSSEDDTDEDEVSGGVAEPPVIAPQVTTSKPPEAKPETTKAMKPATTVPPVEPEQVPPTTTFTGRASDLSRLYDSELMTLAAKRTPELPEVQSAAISVDSIVEEILKAGPKQTGKGNNLPVPSPVRRPGKSTEAAHVVHRSWEQQADKTTDAPVPAGAFEASKWQSPPVSRLPSRRSGRKNLVFRRPGPEWELPPQPQREDIHLGSAIFVLALISAGLACVALSTGVVWHEINPLAVSPVVLMPAGIGLSFFAFLGAWRMR